MRLYYSKTPMIFKDAVGVSVLLLMYSIFHWQLVNFYGKTIDLLIISFVYIIFTIVFLWTVFYPVFRIKAHQKMAFYPLLVCLITAILVYSIDLTSMMIKIDFALNLHRRQKIAQTFRPVIPPDTRDSSSYRYLHNRELIFERKGDSFRLLFRTSRGEADLFRGFVFVSDTTSFKATDFESSISHVRKMKEHWYYVE